MQYLVLAYDAKDPDALKRRMEAREAHLACIAQYKAMGCMHMGAALLDDEGTMIGSSIIAEFPSRKELDVWLTEDPYVTHNVWDEITITPCKIAPSFAK